MIYIFDFAKEICSLPGRLCAAVGELCRKVDCQLCTECCEAVGRTYRNFWDQPLSSYLLVAGLLSLAELYFCADTLALEELDGCKLPESAWVGPSGLRVWLYLQIGFTVVNLLFAPYFQHQVWKEIVKEVRAGGDTATMPVSDDKPTKTVKAEVVRSSFQTVFMYDFGVLFYFFALLASCIWSWEGSAWTAGGDGCVLGRSPSWASWLGLVFFWVTVLYSFLWSCCGCCARSVEMTPEGLGYGVV